MSCPNCSSNLYERTALGWLCSNCTYRERLEDTEFLMASRRPGQIHGNVWGETGYLNRDSYVTAVPTKPRSGSIAEFQKLYARNKDA